MSLIQTELIQTPISAIEEKFRVVLVVNTSDSHIYQIKDKTRASIRKTLCPQNMLVPNIEP